MKVDELKEHLDDFITKLDNDELSRKTINIYKTNINNFINYLEENNLSTFSKDDYRKYRDVYMLSKFKLSTINKYIVIINKYLIFLKRDDLKIKQLKHQRKNSVENVPSNVDYKRILRAAKKDNILDAYYMALVFGYTGIRVSELSYITVDSLKNSKKDKCILIFNKGKYREIMIPKWLRRELLTYAKAKHYSNYIFPSPSNINFPMPRVTCWRRMQKITCLAKVDKKKGHPHAFRHLFGKNYLKYVNNDYQQVADTMGHNSTRTSEIYTQLSREEKAEKIDNFRYM